MTIDEFNGDAVRAHDGTIAAAAVSIATTKPRWPRCAQAIEQFRGCSAGGAGVAAARAGSVARDGGEAGGREGRDRRVRRDQHRQVGADQRAGGRGGGRGECPRRLDEGRVERRLGGRRLCRARAGRFAGRARSTRRGSTKSTAPAGRDGTRGGRAGRPGAVRHRFGSERSRVLGAGRAGGQPQADSAGAQQGRPVHAAGAGRADVGVHGPRLAGIVDPENVDHGQGRSAAGGILRRVGRRPHAAGMAEADAGCGRAARADSGSARRGRQGAGGAQRGHVRGRQERPDGRAARADAERKGDGRRSGASR